MGWQSETYQSDEQAQQEWEQETGPREQHGGDKLTPQKAHGHFSCYPPGTGELGAINNGFSNLCPVAITISALKGLSCDSVISTGQWVRFCQSLCLGLP